MVGGLEEFDESKFRDDQTAEMERTRFLQELFVLRPKYLNNITVQVFVVCLYM